MAEYITNKIPYEDRVQVAGIKFEELAVEGRTRFEYLNLVFKSDDGMLIQVDLTPYPDMEWFDILHGVNAVESRLRLGY